MNGIANINIFTERSVLKRPHPYLDLKGILCYSVLQELASPLVCQLMSASFSIFCLLLTLNIVFRGSITRPFCDALQEPEIRGRFLVPLSIHSVQHNPPFRLLIWLAVTMVCLAGAHVLSIRAHLPRRLITATFLILLIYSIIYLLGTTAISIGRLFTLFVLFHFGGTKNSVWVIFCEILFAVFSFAALSGVVYVWWLFCSLSQARGTDHFHVSSVSSPENVIDSVYNDIETTSAYRVANQMSPDQAELTHMYSITGARTTQGNMTPISHNNEPLVYIPLLSGYMNRNSGLPPVIMTDPLGKSLTGMIFKNFFDEYNQQIHNVLERIHDSRDEHTWMEGQDSSLLLQSSSLLYSLLSPPTARTHARSRFILPRNLLYAQHRRVNDAKAYGFRGQVPTVGDTFRSRNFFWSLTDFLQVISMKLLSKDVLRQMRRLQALSSGVSKSTLLSRVSRLAQHQPGTSFATVLFLLLGAVTYPGLCYGLRTFGYRASLLDGIVALEPQVHVRSQLLRLFLGGTVSSPDFPLDFYLRKYLQKIIFYWSLGATLPLILHTVIGLLIVIFTSIRFNYNQFTEYLTLGTSSRTDTSSFGSSYSAYGDGRVGILSGVLSIISPSFMASHIENIIHYTLKLFPHQLCLLSFVVSLALASVFIGLFSFAIQRLGSVSLIVDHVMGLSTYARFSCAIDGDIDMFLRLQALLSTLHSVSRTHMHVVLVIIYLLSLLLLGLPLWVMIQCSGAKIVVLGLQYSQDVRLSMFILSYLMELDQEKRVTRLQKTRAPESCSRCSLPTASVSSQPLLQPCAGDDFTHGSIISDEMAELGEKLGVTEEIAPFLKQMKPLAMDHAMSSFLDCNDQFSREKGCFFDYSQRMLQEIHIDCRLTPPLIAHLPACPFECRECSMSALRALTPTSVLTGSGIRMQSNSYVREGFHSLVALEGYTIHSQDFVMQLSMTLSRFSHVITGVLPYMDASSAIDTLIQIITFICTGQCIDFRALPSPENLCSVSSWITGVIDNVTSRRFPNEEEASFAGTFIGNQEAAEALSGATQPRPLMSLLAVMQLKSASNFVLDALKVYMEALAVQFYRIFAPHQAWVLVSQLLYRPSSAPLGQYGSRVFQMAHPTDPSLLVPMQSNSMSMLPYMEKESSVDTFLSARTPLLDSRPISRGTAELTSEQTTSYCGSFTGVSCKQTGLYRHLTAIDVVRLIFLSIGCEQMSRVMAGSSSRSRDRITAHSIGGEFPSTAEPHYACDHHSNRGVFHGPTLYNTLITSTVSDFSRKNRSRRFMDENQPFFAATHLTPRMGTFSSAHRCPWQSFDSLPLYSPGLSLCMDHSCCLNRRPNARAIDSQQQIRSAVPTAIGPNDGQFLRIQDAGCATTGIYPHIRVGASFNDPFVYASTLRGVPVSGALTFLGDEEQEIREISAAIQFADLIPGIGQREFSLSNGIQPVAAVPSLAIQSRGSGFRQVSFERGLPCTGREPLSALINPNALVSFSIHSLFSRDSCALLALLSAYLRLFAFAEILTCFIDTGETAFGVPDLQYPCTKPDGSIAPHQPLPPLKSEVFPDDGEMRLLREDFARNARFKTMSEVRTATFVLLCDTRNDLMKRARALHTRFPELSEGAALHYLVAELTKNSEEIMGIIEDPGMCLCVDTGLSRLRYHALQVLNSVNSTSFTPYDLFISHQSSVTADMILLQAFGTHSLDTLRSSPFLVCEDVARDAGRYMSEVRALFEDDYKRAGKQAERAALVRATTEQLAADSGVVVVVPSAEDESDASDGLAVGVGVPAVVASAPSGYGDAIHIEDPESFCSVTFSSVASVTIDSSQEVKTISDDSTESAQTNTTGSQELVQNRSGLLSLIGDQSAPLLSFFNMSDALEPLAKVPTAEGSVEEQQDMTTQSATSDSFAPRLFGNNDSLGIEPVNCGEGVNLVTGIHPGALLDSSTDDIQLLPESSTSSTRKPDAIPELAFGGSILHSCGLLGMPSGLQSDPIPTATLSSDIEQYEAIGVEYTDDLSSTSSEADVAAQKAFTTGPLPLIPLSTRLAVYFSFSDVEMTAGESGSTSIDAHSLSIFDSVSAVLDVRRWLTPEMLRCLMFYESPPLYTPDPVDIVPSSLPRSSSLVNVPVTPGTHETCEYYSRVDSGTTVRIPGHLLDHELVWHGQHIPNDIVLALRFAREHSLDEMRSLINGGVLLFHDANGQPLPHSSRCLIARSDPMSILRLAVAGQLHFVSHYRSRRILVISLLLVAVIIIFMFCIIAGNYVISLKEVRAVAYLFSSFLLAQESLLKSTETVTQRLPVPFIDLRTGHHIDLCTSNSTAFRIAPLQESERFSHSYLQPDFVWNNSVCRNNSMLLDAGVELCRPLDEGFVLPLAQSLSFSSPRHLARFTVDSLQDIDSVVRKNHNKLVTNHFSILFGPMPKGLPRGHNMTNTERYLAYPQSNSPPSLSFAQDIVMALRPFTIERTPHRILDAHYRTTAGVVLGEEMYRYFVPLVTFQDNMENYSSSSLAFLVMLSSLWSLASFGLIEVALYYHRQSRRAFQVFLTLVQSACHRVGITWMISKSKRRATGIDTRFFAEVASQTPTQIVNVARFLGQLPDSGSISGAATSELPSNSGCESPTCQTRDCLGPSMRQQFSPIRIETAPLEARVGAAIMYRDVQNHLINAEVAALLSLICSTVPPSVYSSKVDFSGFLTEPFASQFDVSSLPPNAMQRHLVQRIRVPLMYGGLLTEILLPQLYPLIESSLLPSKLTKELMRLQRTLIHGLNDYGLQLLEANDRLKLQTPLDPPTHDSSRHASVVSEEPRLVISSDRPETLQNEAVQEVADTLVQRAFMHTDLPIRGHELLGHSSYFFSQRVQSCLSRIGLLRNRATTSAVNTSHMIPLVIWIPTALFIIMLFTRTYSVFSQLSSLKAVIRQSIEVQIDALQMYSACIHASTQIMQLGGALALFSHDSSRITPNPSIRMSETVFSDATRALVALSGRVTQREAFLEPLSISPLNGLSNEYHSIGMEIFDTLTLITRNIISESGLGGQFELLYNVSGTPEAVRYIPPVSIPPDLAGALSVVSHISRFRASHPTISAMQGVCTNPMNGFCQGYRVKSSEDIERVLSGRDLLPVSPSTRVRRRSGATTMHIGDEFLDLTMGHAIDQVYIKLIPRLQSSIHGLVRSCAETLSDSLSNTLRSFHLLWDGARFVLSVFIITVLLVAVGYIVIFARRRPSGEATDPSMESQGQSAGTSTLLPGGFVLHGTRFCGDHGKSSQFRKHHLQRVIRMVSLILVTAAFAGFAAMLLFSLYQRISDMDLVSSEYLRNYSKDEPVILSNPLNMTLIEEQSRVLGPYPDAGLPPPALPSLVKPGTVLPATLSGVYSGFIDIQVISFEMSRFVSIIRTLTFFNFTGMNYRVDQQSGAHADAILRTAFTLRTRLSAKLLTSLNSLIRLRNTLIEAYSAAFPSTRELVASLDLTKLDGISLCSSCREHDHQGHFSSFDSWNELLDRTDELVAGFQSDPMSHPIGTAVVPLCLLYQNEDDYMQSIEQGMEHYMSYAVGVPRVPTGEPSKILRTQTPARDCPQQALMGFLRSWDIIFAAVKRAVTLRAYDVHILRTLIPPELFAVSFDYRSDFAATGFCPYYSIQPRNMPRVMLSVLPQCHEISDPLYTTSTEMMPPRNQDTTELMAARSFSVERLLSLQVLRQPIIAYSTFTMLFQRRETFIRASSLQQVPASPRRQALSWFADWIMPTPSARERVEFEEARNSLTSEQQKAIRTFGALTTPTAYQKSVGVQDIVPLNSRYLRMIYTVTELLLGLSIAGVGLWFSELVSVPFFISQGHECSTLTAPRSSRLKRWIHSHFARRKDNARVFIDVFTGNRLDLSANVEELMYMDGQPRDTARRSEDTDHDEEPTNGLQPAQGPFMQVLLGYLLGIAALSWLLFIVHGLQRMVAAYTGANEDLSPMKVPLPPSQKNSLLMSLLSGSILSMRISNTPRSLTLIPLLSGTLVSMSRSILENGTRGISDYDWGRFTGTTAPVRQELDYNFLSSILPRHVASVWSSVFPYTNSMSQIGGSNPSGIRMNTGIFTSVLDGPPMMTLELTPFIHTEYRGGLPARNHAGLAGTLMHDIFAPLRAAIRRSLLGGISSPRFGAFPDSFLRMSDLYTGVFIPAQSALTTQAELKHYTQLHGELVTDLFDAFYQLNEAFLPDHLPTLYSLLWITFTFLAVLPFVPQVVFLFIISRNHRHSSVAIDSTIHSLTTRI